MGGSWSGGSQEGSPAAGAATVESPSGAVGVEGAKYGAPKNNNKGDIVVIPVDPSKQAEAAFEWYVHHVHRPENIVRVVHCQEIQLNQPFLPELKAKTLQDQLDNARAQGKDVIGLYEKKLTNYQIHGSVHSEFATSPGELVLDTLKRYDGSMVVMGTRGFGILRRTILGSVSQYVLNHSHVPVTVVPPDLMHRFF